MGTSRGHNFSTSDTKQRENPLFCSVPSQTRIRTVHIYSRFRELFYVLFLQPFERNKNFVVSAWHSAPAWLLALLLALATLFVAAPATFSTIGSHVPAWPIPTLATQRPGRSEGRGKKTDADGQTDPIPSVGRVNVIYCRFSSELQRPESIADQERRCREHLRRMGIADTDFIVMADEAVSGTPDSRPKFDRLKQLIYADRLGILVVTEQSRLSRGDNVKSLVKDIVFHGGRFISATEGVDTERKGWKMIVGISELHHSRSNEAPPP